MEHQLTLALECEGVTSDAIVTVATVQEAISRPTHATVEVLSRTDIDLEAPLGTKAHLSFSVDGQPVRHFHLLVGAVRFEGLHRGHFRRYTFELTHELSMLAFRGDVRMFQEKDAKDIVSEVLDGAAVPADTLSWSIQRSLVKRVYCVQYRETDLNFVARLLEHEGIFYFIHDDDGGTHVTFADAQSAFPPIEGETALGIVEGRGHGEGVHDFWLETIATPERVTVGDYNFEAPNTLLTADQKAADPARGDVFEYAAGHKTPADGMSVAKIRCEEMMAKSRIGTGTADRWTFRAGTTFDLEGALSEHLNGKYLLTHVTHQVVAHAEEALDQGSYSNTFTCIPHAITFRPPRTAVRPRLRGVHSVVVTGPGGEIHTDEHGRMKGKYFWASASGRKSAVCRA